MKRRSQNQSRNDRGEIMSILTSASYPNGHFLEKNDFGIIILKYSLENMNQNIGIGSKYWYLGQNIGIWINILVFGSKYCIWFKILVFGLKYLYLGQKLIFGSNMGLWVKSGWYGRSGLVVRSSAHNPKLQVRSHLPTPCGIQPLW